MKPGIHPDYAPVVYRDASTGDEILTRSTQTSDRTTVWQDGTTYPLVVVDTSSFSHPFYTGRQQIVDTAGRVERFRRRYGGQTPAP